MSKHTPEPWRVGTDGPPFYAGETAIIGKSPYGEAEHPGGFILAQFNHNFPDLAAANAARSELCVNALANIPDPAAFVRAARALADDVEWMLNTDASVAAFRAADARPGVTSKE